jgi:hypothetical protein
MILISFNGAVNSDNFRIYDDIFSDKTAVNPNNCSTKATFFVSHKYTNYSAVQVIRSQQLQGHDCCCWQFSAKMVIFSLTATYLE